MALVDQEMVLQTLTREIVRDAQWNIPTNTFQMANPNPSMEAGASSLLCIDPRRLNQSSRCVPAVKQGKSNLQLALSLTKPLPSGTVM